MPMLGRAGRRSGVQRLIPAMDLAFRWMAPQLYTVCAAGPCGATMLEWRVLRYYREQVLSWRERDWDADQRIAVPDSMLTCASGPGETGHSTRWDATPHRRQGRLLHGLKDFTGKAVPKTVRQPRSGSVARKRLTPSPRTYSGSRRAGRATRHYRGQRLDIAPYLAAGFVETDDRACGVVGPLTASQHVHNAPDELRISGRREAQLLAQPGFEIVLMSVWRRISCQIASTTFGRTTSSDNSRKLRWARPSGGIEQARGMRRASWRPSRRRL